MSRHVDEILTLIDTALGDRPGNDDGPEQGAVARDLGPDGDNPVGSGSTTSHERP